MDPLVEIRGFAASTAESMWSSLTRVWAPKSTGAAKFYGPGTTLSFDRGRIASPLVYVYRGKMDGPVDASLIESGLRIGRAGVVPSEELPYWPSFRAATPEQRSYYIDWLLEGRSNPDMPIGYVFIYFYGLERRILVDHSDYDAVSEEILRLLEIYHKSRSFVRYATGLLWTTMWLRAKQEQLSQRILTDLASRTQKWSEDTLALWLASFARWGYRLSADMAYLIASHDVRAPRSVITQRHSELHKSSFQTRFQGQYPSGLELKVSKSERRLEYFAASATLGRLHDSGGPLSQERVPNVLGLSSQFKPLIEMWTESIDELKAYDRAHRKAGGGDELSVEMYEALPEDLRQGEHPHFDAWYEAMNRHVTDDGWTVVPVSEFAHLEGIPGRKKITKSLSIQLATTAGHMGLALEPDPRITGKSYSWDDLVSVFPATEELSHDIASYHAAATLLELGVTIAAADGQIDDVELGRLASHLETQFDLSTQDVARLEHLRHLLTIRPPQEFAAARTMRKNLKLEQRRLVGEFLVGIAAADEVIAPQEVKALSRAYRALGLEDNDLNRLVQSMARPATENAPPSAADSFQLDVNRINAIMAETTKVSEFLKEALREDFADSEEESTLDEVNSVSVPQKLSVFQPEQTAPRSQTESHHQFPGLNPRFVPFVTTALQRDVWLRTDLEEVARSFGLMLGSALESVNEWAVETLPDMLLVESDEDIVVQRNLLM